MKRVWSVAALAAACSLFGSGDAAAQAGVFLGGGATMPTGDFGDFANVGWMGFGGVGFPVGQDGLFLGAEGFYGSNGHEVEGIKTNLYGGNALIGVNFYEQGEAGPFVAAGLGLMTQQLKSETIPALEDSASGFALTGLAGLSFPLGTVEGMLSATFTRAFGDLEDLMFAGIFAGIGIPVGGGGM
jgi:hypothetical protein